MWWDISALISALLWAIGTLWAMYADLIAVSQHKQELLRTTGDIAREQADAKIPHNPILRKLLTPWRDWLEVRYMWKGNDAQSTYEAKAIRVHHHRVLAWLTLCVAGAGGILAASRPFAP